MLAQRVVTAVVLLAVVFAAVLAPQSWPMLLLLGVLAATTLWEWLRLTLPARFSGLAVVAGALFFAISSFLIFTQAGRDVLMQCAGTALLPLLWAVALFWVFGSVAGVVRGKVDLPAASLVYSVVGVFAMLATWLSLILLLLHKGPWFLVSLLALIWFADVAAYFSGKTFGRRKLAPRVSPGKTWEGALGGVVAAVVWVFVSGQWSGTFGQALLAQWPWFFALVFAAGLGAISIVGDLFESLLKRRAGFKDSSGLLPGHGGVFDRIDALLPVAPLAFLLIGI